MILKTLKQNSNKKQLNKLLSERQLFDSDAKLESLGIVVNIDEGCHLDWFKTLDESFKVRPNKFKIIAFSKKKQNHLNTWDACYNPEDFGWNGHIKNTELETFLTTSFDVLISYYSTDVLELKLITALSKSKFKIGILQTEERLNDIIIKTKINEFEVFKNEVIKYLTILNKIK